MKNRKKDNLEKNTTWKQNYSRKLLRKGTYNSVLTILICAIVVSINIMVSFLPVSVRQIDLSRDRIYELSELTMDILDSLDEEVEIYAIENTEDLDGRIKNLLDKYEALSDRIAVTYIDPIENPTFAGSNNTSTSSVFVKCPNTGKQRTISFSDIICYDEYTYVSTGEYVETEFDGEGQLTSAIYYVTGIKDSKMYYTAGHNEQVFSASVAKMFNKSNIGSETLDLTEGEIPQDCEMLIIYAPTEDFQPSEVEKVETYLNNGGRVFFINCQKYITLENLDGFLADYGLITQTGYAGDPDRSYQDTDYYMFPVLNTESEILGNMEAEDQVLVLMSKGYVVDDTRSDLQIVPFMMTSKSGNLTTPEGSTDMELVVGAAVTAGPNEDSGRLVVIGSEMMINESIISYSNIKNMDVFMDAVIWLMGEVETLPIEAKSLEVERNVMSHIYWYGLPIIGIPMAILITGIVIRIKRQKKSQRIV